MMSKRIYWSILLALLILLLVVIYSFLTYLINHFRFSTNKPQYNIILIISDQESYRLAKAEDYKLAAREALARHGITFTNHYTAAAMCSPSRASLLTGVAPQVHRVFDQVEYGYVPSLNPQQPNMGSVLKKLSYRTAYFGEFGLDKKLISPSDTENYSTLIRAYGFDIFNAEGDVSGQPQQGYTDDPYFVGEAIRWLRKNAQSKNQTPFFLVISLLNPHDITYGDANLVNTVPAQIAKSQVILSPPENTIYRTSWQFNLPTNLNESLVAKGMPDALNQYQQGWASALGFIPPDRKDMWTYYYNYYLNALRDNDFNLQLIVKTLDQLDLWKTTIIIFTADHGEMGGAHGGLRGKGPMAYEENAHVPLIITHPKAPQGATCAALTSHLDLLPTLVGLTGLSKAKIAQITQAFPGHDFSSFLFKPQKANVDAIRNGVLFNYVGISTIDGKYLLNTLTSTFSRKPLPPLREINLSKRGFLSFVFDGRYKFARYYSPNHIHTPKTLEEIFAYNDLQLFDLQEDPKEMNNLVLQPEENRELILRMNNLLNELIEKEVGKNDLTFLPAIK